MLSCREVLEILTDYLEGKISLPRRLSFRIHLWRCHNCCRFFRQFRKVVMMTHQIPEGEVPEDFCQHMEALFKDYYLRKK